MNQFMITQHLLKIIDEIDSNEKYFGIIPISVVYIKVKETLNLPIKEFHDLVLNLEKEQIIYLEVINDITRLSIEEKNTAIYDKVRGYLYYIGRWK